MIFKIIIIIIVNVFGGNRPPYDICVTFQVLQSSSVPHIKHFMASKAFATSGYNDKCLLTLYF